MASRFLSPVFDTGPGSKPASGAKLNFFETGTSTRKATFTTAAANIPNDNPVIADSNGVFPDIFITGTYKVILTTKDDIQTGFGEKDPIVESVDLTVISGLNPDTLAAWQADASAQVGDVVTTKERSTGKGGGATGDVITGTGTANGANIVAHDTLSLSWVLRVGEFIIPEQFGLFPDNTHRPVIELAMQDYANANFTPIQWGFSTKASPYLIGDLIFVASMFGQGKKKTFITLRPDWTQANGNTNRNSVISLEDLQGVYYANFTVDCAITAARNSVVGIRFGGFCDGVYIQSVDVLDNNFFAWGIGAVASASSLAGTSDTLMTVKNLVMIDCGAFSDIGNDTLTNDFNLGMEFFPKVNGSENWYIENWNCLGKSICKIQGVDGLTMINYKNKNSATSFDQEGSGHTEINNVQNARAYGGLFDNGSASSASCLSIGYRDDTLNAPDDIILDKVTLKGSGNAVVNYSTSVLGDKRGGTVKFNDCTGIEDLSIRGFWTSVHLTDTDVNDEIKSDNATTKFDLDELVLHNSEVRRFQLLTNNDRLASFKATDMVINNITGQSQITCDKLRWQGGGVQLAAGSPTTFLLDIVNCPDAKVSHTVMDGGSVVNNILRSNNSTLLATFNEVDNVVLGLATSTGGGTDTELANVINGVFVP